MVFGKLKSATLVWYGDLFNSGTHRLKKGFARVVTILKKKLKYLFITNFNMYCGLEGVECCPSRQAFDLLYFLPPQ